MSDQEIILIVGRKDELPNATAVARKLEALIALLESIDAHQWAVGQPRYRWVISSASVGSPAEIAVRGQQRMDSRDFDAGSALIYSLASVEAGRLQDLPAGIGRPQAKIILSLAGRDKEERSIPFRVCVQDRNSADGLSEYTANPKRLHQGAKNIWSSPPVSPQYSCLEGVLARVEAWNNKHRFSLMERGTLREIVCNFSPSDTERIGAHVENRIYVEGMLEDKGNGKPVLKVEHFRLIPKKPIGLDEVHRRRLRIPGGKAATDYVRWLRAKTD